MMATKFESQLSLSRPYLTRLELQEAQNNTVSDVRTYLQRKNVIFGFLSELCVHFQFPRKTLETAMYYYQRYYIFNKFESELCHTVATSCLLLSCKQVETFKKANELCIMSFKLRNMNNYKQDAIESFKKRLFQIELSILETCGFDYRINSRVHIDEYIVKLGKALKLNHDICYLAWIIAYDAIRLNILLIVPQHAIALGILKITCELLGKNDMKNMNNFNEFKTEIDSVNEAYFAIVNYYINAFDNCSLKDNLPTHILPSVNLDSFIELKKNAGNDRGLKELGEQIRKSDKYLTTARDFTQIERRYVLLPQFISDEKTALGEKRFKL
ncbi:hypothetical protein TPHA_0N00950 [Tetrapisispora phaffii CBS 4417]|uniref:Cyclin-like domain-containing protein n=1 Tax=Tetrapisispora phaffii (strain ATCC 24235 / CBS 4417 / NBRC 1672 / NRRL Y-8282 / UCD 70-5) TaxID=1071381 RepID=G8C148_TETPH|nr:hypothetical protein TPHA_0N00950 [Tetrapisispora phaffii CBS 4417]CCE65876.1 hypothetical protein TPHA_0N00950 [Tetrapisispora phaffii CBS 4417]